MDSKLLLVAGALCAVAVSGAPAPALAQSTTAERCRALPTEQERFACMEEALSAAEAALSRDDDDDDDKGGFLGLGIPFLGGEDGPDQAPRRASSAPADLGVEQVSDEVKFAPKEEEQIYPAQAVAYREYVPGLWQIELDNGSVWRQLSGDSTILRLYGRDPLPVEMWESWAGGYRMRLIDQDRVIQVRRFR